MYHSIADSEAHFNSVAPAEFELQMAYLAEKPIPVISLTSLVMRLKNGSPLGGAVVITFDDGFRNNYTVALPILKKYGFPATVFVTTDLIGQTDERGFEHCSPDDMKAMQGSGLIDIQPHTKTHPKLSKLSSGDARTEILESKLAVSTILNKECKLFAYPYGNFSDDTKRVVQELEFDAAVSVREGTVGLHADLFALPRNSIDRSTTLAQFGGKVSRAIDWYHALKVWK